MVDWFIISYYFTSIRWLSWSWSTTLPWITEDTQSSPVLVSAPERVTISTTRWLKEASLKVNFTSCLRTTYLKNLSSLREIFKNWCLRCRRSYLTIVSSVVLSNSISLSLSLSLPPHPPSLPLSSFSLFFSLSLSPSLSLLPNYISVDKATGKPIPGSKAALVYGQMNEPPGARARVALTGLAIAGKKINKKYAKWTEKLN